MSKNKELGKAKVDKKDEFYTSMTDIEAEMLNYMDFFKDKIVLCNCDDPYESNFFKYFAMNFNTLQLKKLIATCYDGSPIVGEQLDLFDLLNEDDNNQNQNGGFTKFEQRWINSWQGFTNDYIKFKKSLSEMLSDIQEHISKVEKQTKEESEYMQKNILDKLDSIENQLYKINKK